MQSKTNAKENTHNRVENNKLNNLDQLKRINKEWKDSLEKAWS